MSSVASIEPSNLAHIRCLGVGRSGVVLSAILMKSNQPVVIKVPRVLIPFYLCGKDRAYRCSRSEPGAALYKEAFDDHRGHFNELKALTQVGLHRNIMRLVGKARIPLLLLRRERHCFSGESLDGYKRMAGANATLPALILEHSGGDPLQKMLDTLDGEGDFAPSNLSRVRDSGCFQWRVLNDSGVAKTQRTVDASWDSFIGLARALQHAHARGVVHNDLTAWNVHFPRLSTSESRLIDFSLSVVCPLANTRSSLNGSLLTNRHSNMSVASVGDVFWFGKLLERLCYGPIRDPTPRLYDALRLRPSQCQEGPPRIHRFAASHQVNQSLNRCAESIQPLMDELMHSCMEPAYLDLSVGDAPPPFSWELAMDHLNKMQQLSPHTPLQCHAAT